MQNAIDLAEALRFEEVRVAILSAMETVNPKVPSTIEAAALCKMADRGQITGGILDGPLALDNAISRGRARHQADRFAGRGARQRPRRARSRSRQHAGQKPVFLAGADAAGIVLGARVPIILTSRADLVVTRLASCAVASLLADARRRSAVRQSYEVGCNAVQPEGVRSRRY